MSLLADRLIDLLFTGRYCIAALLEFAAFVKLRTMPQPELGPRFVVPLGTIGSALMLLPAASFIVVVLILASPSTLLIGSAILAMAPVGYVCGRAGE